MIRFLERGLEQTNEHFNVTENDCQTFVAEFVFISSRQQVWYMVLSSYTVLYKFPMQYINVRIMVKCLIINRRRKKRW